MTLSHDMSEKRFAISREGFQNISVGPMTGRSPNFSFLAFLRQPPAPPLITSQQLMEQPAQVVRESPFFFPCGSYSRHLLWGALVRLAPGKRLAGID